MVGCENRAVPRTRLSALKPRQRLERSEPGQLGQAALSPCMFTVFKNDFCLTLEVILCLSSNVFWEKLKLFMTLPCPLR